MWHSDKPYKTICKACKAPIWMVHTVKGKYMPVDASSVTNGDLMLLDQTGDLVYIHSKHVSHFATCTNPSAFRKK